MKIELRSIEKVIPYANNPRINDAAVEAVARSIREFGFRQPIVVDTQGVIIAGHTRWRAAQTLGMKRVPVHVATGLTAAQVKAYRIADNQTAALAEWNLELLAAELAGLSAEKFDLGLLAFGNELDRMLAGPGPDGALPEPRLADRFLVAPFSVLNAREGWWQDRKRQWLALGIQSELGRGEGTWEESESAGSPIDRREKIRMKGTPPHGPSVTKNPDGTLCYRSPVRAKWKDKASPGGSPRPAANYGKTRARGDGRGAALHG